MSLAGGLLKSWALRRYRKEARIHLSHLRELDVDGVAIILAVVMHQRNMLAKEGINLRDLTSTVQEQPGCHEDLSSAAYELAKKKQPHDALAMHVWAHSLRGVSEPGLRDSAIKIWTELKKGEHRVAAARKYVKKETGFELDISMAKELPKEFSSSL